MPQMLEKQTLLKAGNYQASYKGDKLKRIITGILLLAGEGKRSR